MKKQLGWVFLTAHKTNRMIRIRHEAIMAYYRDDSQPNNNATRIILPAASGGVLFVIETPEQLDELFHIGASYKERE